MPTVNVDHLNIGDEVEVTYSDGSGDYKVTGPLAGTKDKFGKYLLLGPLYVREGSGKASWGVTGVKVLAPAPTPEPPLGSVIVQDCKGVLRAAKRVRIDTEGWTYASDYGYYHGWKTVLNAGDLLATYTP